MGGTHKFTSSIWIQSGSAPATFQSGISSPSITAQKFIGDGSGLTGIGSAVFFAGSGSGISASVPTSIDHVTVLDAKLATAPADYFRIETTSSGQFKPNHFVFVKLTNKFETLQASSQNFYVGSDRVPGGDPSGQDPFNNDLAAGVHRYIVYATDTDTAGETHAVYTSAFIQGYVNGPPEIIAPNQSLGVVQIPHDSNELTHILHFTASNEPNSAQGDFIRVFSASRLDINPTTVNETDAAYIVTMTHAQDNISEVNGEIVTGSIDSTNEAYTQIPGANSPAGSGPGASAIPLSVLAFTASISNYETTVGTTNHSDTIQPSEQLFRIRMFDNWYESHSSSADYSMSIVPPNTASIRDLRVRIESGSFTGTVIDEYTVPVLYDDPGITRTSIDGLHDRYTESIARISVMANITEPDDYIPDETHFTDVMISTADASSPLRNKTFRFSGSTATGLFRATASHYDNGTDFAFTNATESLGFSAFSFTPGVATYFGVASDSTNNLRHGNFNHISVPEVASTAQLTVKAVPNIEISNIRVEVESGSFLTHKGAFERTASVLYGYESTLLVSETSSLEGYEKSAEYISESVVRIRLLATITEPFGPHHTNMQSTLFCSDGEGGLHQHTFAFHTGSEETASSVIAYDDHNRLVGNYTSSFINFNLAPGVYNFNSSFNSSTNAGRDVIPGIFASVSVSATPPTEITNIVYETETAGYSEEGSIDAMRTVLYGVPRHTLADSQSFVGHTHATTYASQSVSRFRVKATITEPFGPHHTASQFEKVWTDDSDILNSVIHFSTGSTDTASSAIAYDSANRLLSHYTSSWVGQQLSSSNGSANTWTYTSGSITHTPHDLSGFTTSSGQSTQLVVNDTLEIQLSNRIHEFEEYGHSASSAADTGVELTIRTVLYGSDRVTLVDSSSLNELPESRRTAYASQSVSRVRARLRVTEPVGPGHGNIKFEPTLVGTRKTLNAFTSSTDFESISYTYDSQKRLIAHYTESWHGVAISGAPTSKTATFKDTATVNQSTFATGENGINKGEIEDASIQVFDTAPTQITNIRYETETFGYSNEPSIETTRKVLYGVAHKTNIDSSSYATHDSASLYASQSVTQFRVLATVTEPVGPLHTASRFEKVWTAPNEATLTNVIHFSTASGDITASAVHEYNLSNQLVSHYTSSWIGKELASNNYTTGEQWKYTSGSILHEPPNENGFTTASGDSTTITVFDTQPTTFSNFKTETETFGYSGEPTQNAFRKVLYGVAHATVANSSSFTGHDSASLYASQSVSQFRIIARITEPVGPLQHTASRIEKTFKNEIETVDSKTETIIFGTASIGFESSRSFFTPVGEFVTEYTTSYEGKALEVQTSALAERDWSISTGSVIHNPPGENAADSSSFTATTVKVRNTEKTKIEKIFWETETFGYSGVETSNTIRTVLYGNNRTTDIDSASYDNHPNSGSYASQSVSRVRFRARITEPLGPAVDNFTVNFTYDGNDNETDLHTGSIETYGGVISSVYENNQLVAHYTSSYFGVQYTVPAGGELIHRLDGEFSENITGENGIEQSDNTLGAITVIDTPATQITNVRYETETFGYSGIPSITTTRKVLYGDSQITNTGTGSGDTGESWASHDSASLYASQSVTRFRILSTITEPVGPLHTASQFEQAWTAPNRSFSDMLHFSTASGDVTESSVHEYNLSNQLVSHYTSSWKGRGLISSIYANDENVNGEAYTYTGVASHTPPGEVNGIVNDITPSAIIVYDTQPTKFENISFETETFGYSGIASTDTTRKVLYGVPHHTLASTQSLYWAGYESASLYASQSITQFRISATITEPIGPLHTGSIIQQQFASSVDAVTEITNVVSEANTITSLMLSSGLVEDAFDTSETSTGYYANAGEELTIVFGQPELIARVEILSDDGSIDPILEASPDGGTTYFAISGIFNNTIVPDRAYTLYRIRFNNPANGLLITNIKLFTTTFTEPRIFKNTTFKLNTTGDVELSASAYENNQIVSHYTSSWFGIQLSSSNNNTGEPWQYTLSNIIHTPGDSSLVEQPENPAATNVRVYDTKAPRYENFKTKTETYGYSNEMTTTAMRTILYGNTATDIDSASYANHPSASTYASHSVSRFHTVARIIEPVGPLLHTGSRSNMVNNGSSIGVIVFGTGSSNFVQSYSTPVGEFIAEYTSSYISESLTVGDYNISMLDTIHQADGENPPVISADDSLTVMIVNDTLPTQIDSIAYETETHGYSGIASTNTTRKVLYGDNGTTNTNSESFAEHINSIAYASHSVSQFRVRVRITEPVGPLHSASKFERVWSANSESPLTDTLHFSTASNNIISRSYSDTAGRFIVEYTTSFAGKALTAPNDTTREWIYTSGSISHEPEGEAGFITASGESSVITVTGTPQTQIQNIRVETETVGHSTIGVQNTNESNAYAISRSILYGETTSFANSASFEGLDPIFAKSSVTRFRVLANITEPLGPHHTGSLFAYTKDAVIDIGQGHDSSQTVAVGEGTSDFIIFSTASVQTASSDIEFNTSTKELEASYTSSWFEENLSPSKVLTDGYWHINVNAANIHHTPVDESGVNKDTSATNLYMVVSASKPLTVTNLRTEVEAFPYSSSIGAISRTEEILYGYNRTLSASDADTVGDIWSGSAAIRFRTLATITEPIGFQHFKTQFTMSNANVGERGYEFHTASLETSSRSARTLNSEGQFITHYTSAFHNGFTFEEGTYTFAPIAKTGSDADVGLYIDRDGIKITKIGEDASIEIANTPVTQITNLKIEAETFSGSAVGTDNRVTTILHGNTLTEADKTINTGYPNATAREQLTSVRLLADITEPFGPHHTASIFTISGYGSTHKVRLHTGSADLLASAVQIYDTHGSASVAYTSSFVPLELQQGTFDNINVITVEHEFEDRKTTSEGTHATITVEGPPTASVFVSPQTGSQFFSSSVDIDKYVTYDSANNIVVDIISGISASAPPETSESILTFPQHLNILYTELDSELSFSPVTGNLGNEDTASLTISNTSMDDFTEVKEFTVNVEGSDILPGSGSSGDSSLTFSVIPAKPQTMNGKYWGPAGTDGAHVIGSTGINVPSVDSKPQQLYQGTLATGLPLYNEVAGHSGGTEVDNIIMAKTSGNGPADYAITFNTFTPSDTGNYDDDNRLFDRGDKGSLIVKINDYKVIEADLAVNFKTENKSTGQQIGTYDAGGFTNGIATFQEFDPNTNQLVGKGKLILTQVGPFNNVDDNIFANGEHYPNGYQGWSARIELTDKLYDGYNKLEFIHEFEDGTSQAWQPFEWYYDDHTVLADTDASVPATYSVPTNEPTFSRSGVSFFATGQDVNFNINEAFTGIVGDTYTLDSQQIMETNLSTGLEFSDVASSGTHRLNSDANANGLSFPINPLTPNRDAIGSLSITLKAIAVTDSENGDVKSINVKQFNRDYSDPHTFTKETTGQAISLGRFAAEPTTVSTDATEHFFTEDYRWQQETMEANSTNNQLGTGYDATAASNVKNNFLYWTDTTKTDYNSNTDLLLNDELQISHLGHLMYPELVYTGLPNSRDYSAINDDRYFYRAFDVFTGPGQNANQFAFIIYYGNNTAITKTDIFAQNPEGFGTVDIDSLPLRIDIKFPGAVDSNQQPANPGSGWGSIGGGSTTVSSPGLDNWTSNNGGNDTTPDVNFVTAGNDLTKGGSTKTCPDNAVLIYMRTGNWGSQLTKGIVLLRARIKTGFDKKITRIDVSEF